MIIIITKFKNFSYIVHLLVYFEEKEKQNKQNKQQGDIARHSLTTHFVCKTIR